MIDPLVVPFVSLGLSVVALLYTILRNQSVKYEAFAERLVKLETRSDAMWKITESNLAQLLHSPDHPERDVLLQKYQQSLLAPQYRSGLLTTAETKRLHTLLSGIATDIAAEMPQRIIAVFLLAAMVQRLDGLAGG